MGWRLTPAMARQSKSDGQPPSRPATSAWTALWKIASRSKNPLDSSSRSLAHPFRFFPWLVVAIVLWGVALSPFSSFVKFSRAISQTTDSSSIIQAALEHSIVRGHQRRFLEEWRPGSYSASPPRQDIGPIERLSLPVAVSAPGDMKAALNRVLDERGVPAARSDCSQCLKVTWKNSGEDSAWSAWVHPHPGSDSDIPQVQAPDPDELSLAVEGLIREAIAYLPSPSSITLAPVGQDQAVREGLLLSARFAIHMIVLVAVWLMVLAAGSMIGAMWDRRRTLGELEVLVGAHHPPWVAYLGLTVRHSMVALIIYSALLVVLRVFGLPVHWPFLLAMTPLAVSLVFLFSLWSVFITTVIHHPRGRSYARILLSPLTLSVVWALRLLFVWTALKAYRPLQFIEGFESILSSWPWLLAAVPLVWGVSAVLWTLIEWRMGRRREGLREAKRS